MEYGHPQPVTNVEQLTAEEIALMQLHARHYEASKMHTSADKGLDEVSQATENLRWLVFHGYSPEVVQLLPREVLPLLKNLYQKQIDAAARLRDEMIRNSGSGLLLPEFEDPNREDEAYEAIDYI